jgi:benzoate membrane transport protein
MLDYSPIMLLRESIAALPRAITVSTVLAGVMIVIVGFTGSLVLTFEVARNARLPAETLNSWVFAIIVGSGVASLTMSLYFKQPMLTAWSTPGLAVLASSLADYSLGEAVGAYLTSSAVIIVLGVSGLFERVLKLVPQSVALAVLGGVLLRFGLGVFTALMTQPLIVLTMIAVFLLIKRQNWAVPMAWALGAGVLAALLTGQVNGSGVTLALTLPVLYAPEFSVRALIGLTLPLTALALTSQNAPGFAVMRAFEYEPQIKGGLFGTGLISLLTAPMLSHGVTMSALTAALANSPEAHPDKSLRYGAAVSAGVLKILLGFAGATIVSLFQALPVALVSAMAGLALSGTIMGCITGAFAEAKDREAALFALFMTASGAQYFGLGSAFWGLVTGVVFALVLRPPVKAAAST